MDITPLLRGYAAIRRAFWRSQDAAKCQESELLRLVRRAANTRFGKDHDFGSIRSVRDFQSRVPLRTYEQFWEAYGRAAYPVWRDLSWPGEMPFFALSSGTSSGTTKYIPVSREMVRSNQKAAFDLLVHHVTNRPQSRILGGRNLILGGSTNLRSESAGVWSGDLSGIAAKTIPSWLRRFSFPPAELTTLSDWEEKITKIAQVSLSEDIRMISGVPAWMLLFFEQLRMLRPESDGRLSELFPNLEMVVHGGVPFGPYLQVFERAIAGSHAEFREVYPASEGFIAIADRGSNEGMRLNLDHGIFFEFVPFEELGKQSPTRHWVQNIELNVNYAVVLSTCAGLWSHIIGDTVKFVDRSPPRLLITGRTSYYLSAFGEHVIAQELDTSISNAASAVGVEVQEYAVGPIFPKSAGELGGHLYIIEFRGRIPQDAELSRFSACVDTELQRLNEDYAGHRANGFGLRAPEIMVAPPGAFNAWMKHRGKLGGQNKVPRIITKTELLEDLKTFVMTCQ